MLINSRPFCLTFRGNHSSLDQLQRLIKLTTKKLADTLKNSVIDYYLCVICHPDFIHSVYHLIRSKRGEQENIYTEIFYSFSFTEGHAGVTIRELHSRWYILCGEKDEVLFNRRTLGWVVVNRVNYYYSSNFHRIRRVMMPFSVVGTFGF